MKTLTFIVLALCFLCGYLVLEVKRLDILFRDTQAKMVRETPQEIARARMIAEHLDKFHQEELNRMWVKR